MTREERAIQILEQRACCMECVVENYTCAECNEAFEMAIKALEQEPILDRIRDKIWDLQYGPEEKSMTDEDRADAYNNAISQAIEIIDKYKAKREGAHETNE